jgi:hypothetical protein
MKLVEWSMQGIEVVTCNCNTGCPCQFNSLPSHGNCSAYGLVQIEKGHFGDVRLDGLRWGVLAAWPGAIHEGNGTFQTIIDERADSRQRDAIEAVSHGKETEPGTLIWQVFSTTVTQFLPTLVKPIGFTYDFKARTATMRVPGVLDAAVSPIRNAVTGAEQEARLTLPKGFEFTEADFAAGTGRADSGPIHLNFNGTHSHFARIHWGTHGVVRDSERIAEIRHLRESVAVA